MLAFAQAYTSLAGLELLNLESLPAQAVSAVVPNGLQVLVAAIVILSLVASGAIVTFEPATSVSVSVAESAATVVDPTTTLLNAF